MVWLDATRPLQKHSWHIWKLWHFWQRYRNPVKLSRRQASQEMGWVTLKLKQSLSIYFLNHEFNKQTIFDVS